MNSSRRTIASLTLGLLAPLALAVPAQADEPAPADPCAQQNRLLETWKASTAYWQGATIQAREDASAEILRLVTERNDWRDQALATTEALGTRTEQRDQLLAEVNRVTRQRDRLKAKVAELRQRLAGGPRS